MTATLQPPLDDYALWHPMTSMPRYARSPLTLGSGDGAHVEDIDGNTFLSGNAALWNVACGFGHERIDAAVREQLEALSYGTLFRSGHEPARLLARRLVELFGDGDLTRAFFTTSGGTAVDTALKLARRYQRLAGRAERTVVAALEDAYHGTTYGSMAVTGEPVDQDEYAVDRRHVLHLPTPGLAPCPACPPGARACTDACGQAAVARLEPHAGRLAAVIVEPVLGSAGVVVPPHGFFSALQAFCERHDTLLIIDEVATGFGRTGRWFAHEWFDLSPDLVVLSKALNNGALPLGAVMVHERVWRAFHESGADFAHGETQAGNPLACAAGIATVEVIASEGLVERAARSGSMLRARVEALLGATSLGSVSGLGLMLGLHLRQPRRPSAEQVLDIVEALLRHGVIVHPSPLGLSLFPPLTISDDDVEELCEALGAVLETVALR